MIDYNVPPELTIDHIAILLTHMQPEDVKRFNEYCMIHFPSWLFKIIKRESELCNMSFEEFVRLSCLSEIRRNVERRNEDDKANRNI